MARHPEEQYDLLNGQDEDEDVEHSGTSKRTRAPTASRRLTGPTTIALIAFVVIDVLAYFYIAKALLGLPVPSHSNPAQLDFRNPYFGLDDMYRLTNITASKYPRIINAPRFTAQVSSSEPDKVSQIDPHRWTSNWGLLSPPDRRFQVSPTIHTILQFSVLDYGMEKCSLVINLPKRDEKSTYPTTFDTNNVDGTIQLDICQLDTKRPIDESKLSWNERPPCTGSVETLSARVGEEVEFPSFKCTSGEFLAYEVSCSSNMPDCGVDVWLTKDRNWGMTMYQYQTV